MASDLASLQVATASVISEVQKQADALAKQLQSLAPPQEGNSPSVQYLLDISAHLNEFKKNISLDSMS